MKKRIFVAVDISEKARKTVAGYISELKSEFPNVKVGWDKPEKLHLTLKFLGDVDERQFEELKVVTKNIAERFSSLKFEISGTGVFSSERNARVLWLGVKGDVEKLQAINSLLELQCEQIGFPRGTRNYRPHLTIGRIREPQKARGLATKHLENKIEPVEFEVSAIAIYESKLQPTGSIYQKIISFSFSTR